MQKLTAKQEMFVEEYLIDLNATQASIRAGYSQNSARQIATEMLSKPYIQEAIAIEKAKRVERIQITADDVLRSLLKVRNISEQEVYDEYKQVNDMLDKNSVIKTNELLGKHLAMWTDRVDSNVKVTGVQIVDDVDED